MRSKSWRTVFLTVAEIDALECDIGADGLQGLRIFGFDDVVLRVEQREHHAGNLSRLLELVVQADERLERLVEEENAADELHQIAGLHLFPFVKKRDVDEKGRDADGSEDFHHRARQFAGADDAHLVVRHEAGGGFKFIRRFFLEVVGLEDAVTAEGFVDEFALLADLRHEDLRGFSHAARIHDVGQQGEGKHRHGEQRELRMADEQERDEAHDGDGLADDGDPGIAERVLDAVGGLELRHERAGAGSREEAGAEAEHVAEHFHPEIHDHAHGDPIHEIDIHVAESRAKDHRERDEHDDDDDHRV